MVHSRDVRVAIAQRERAYSGSGVPEVGGVWVGKCDSRCWILGSNVEAKETWGSHVETMADRIAQTRIRRIEFEVPQVVDRGKEIAAAETGPTQEQAPP